MDSGPLRGRRTADQTTSLLAPVLNRLPDKSRAGSIPFRALWADGHAPGWFSRPTANYGVLQDFVQSSQPWSRRGIPLPRRLRRTLWTLIPVELAWSFWLVIVLIGGASCDGPICAVATLGNHVAALLACALVSFGGLIGLVPFTRGFSQCNGRQVAGVAVAAVAGVVALLGIAALIIGAAIGLIFLAAIVAIVGAAFGSAFAETS
jgi:hypothetical protein